MKTSIKFFALLLSVLALSGCSTCPCSKKAAPAPEVVAPVVAPVVQAAAPVATPVAEPATDAVAARQYVNK